VSIRNVRRHAKDALDRMARDGEAGEDDVARAEKQLEVITRKYVDQVDDVLKHKEAELLEV
jgi:ribosome recycling factor